MATASDINTVAAVRKYLEHDLVVNRWDEEADPNDEITALLSTIALSFLLYPQSVLCFVQRAKNALQQVVIAELELLDYIYAIFADLINQDEPITDTSDLVEAQAALVELDRLGRVNTELVSYTRYTEAIQRFLNQQLARPLKRHGRKEFERSGREAKIDLFQSSAALGAAHQSMAQRLKDLAASVDNYFSVDLTRLVSTKAITRIRSSLQQIKDGLDQQELSKTVAAIELLSGTAALRAISNPTSVYDPAIETGQFPVGRTITAAAEQVPAVATTSAGPWTLTPPAPWVVGLLLDGAAEVEATFPSVPFLLAQAPGQATYTIPTSASLFLYYRDGTGDHLVEAPLTAGSRTRAEVILDLNTGLGAVATCTALNATGPLLISAAGTTSWMLVQDHGEGTLLGGIYVPPRSSAHAVLGFQARQQSDVAGVVSVDNLVNIIKTYWPTAALTVLNGVVTISSPTEGVGSSLQFTQAAGDLGLSLVEVLAEPGYLTLQEAAADLAPLALGVYPGSRVEVSGDRFLAGLVQSIDGYRLYFSEPLPRGVDLAVKVSAPLVVIYRPLLEKLKLLKTSFDNDLPKIQMVFSPLMGNPGLAQINDAKKQVQDLRTRLASLLDLLDDAVVSEDRQQYSDVASNILMGLSDRSLDRSVDLLTRGLFAYFFGLTKDSTSSGSRFLRSMEEVGRNDLATPSEEEDIEEAVTPTNPNDKVFPSREEGD